MRPKIILPLLIVVAAGVTFMLLFKPTARQPSPAAAPVAQPVAALVETSPAVPPLVPLTNRPAAATPASLTDATPHIPGSAAAPNAESIQTQINRLEALEANDDAASLQAILKELTNTNRIIRQAAIEASIQFGNRSAIPVLQELAARTADPAEKQELLDAAEFLALPTLTEVNAQKQLEKAQGVVPPQ